MESIITFINEKLKVSSNTKINNSIDNIKEVKRGEIIKYVFDKKHNSIAIFNEYSPKQSSIGFLGEYNYDTQEFHTQSYTWTDRISKLEYATKEEIDELMDIIDDNGYKYVNEKNKRKLVKK